MHLELHKTLSDLKASSWLERMVISLPLFSITLTFKEARVTPFIKLFVAPSYTALSPLSPGHFFIPLYMVFLSLLILLKSYLLGPFHGY